MLVQQRAAMDDEMVEKIVIDLACSLGKKVVDLTEEDLARDALGAVLLQRRTQQVDALTRRVRDRLVGKIERGAQTLSGTRFLHTEPHHDDLMLGYLSYIRPPRARRDQCALFRLLYRRFYGGDQPLYRGSLATAAVLFADR